NEKSFVWVADWAACGCPIRHPHKVRDPEGFWLYCKEGYLMFIQRTSGVPVMFVHGPQGEDKPSPLLCYASATSSSPAGGPCLGDRYIACPRPAQTPSKNMTRTCTSAIYTSMFLFCFVLLTSCAGSTATTTGTPTPGPTRAASIPSSTPTATPTPTAGSTSGVTPQ